MKIKKYFSIAKKVARLGNKNNLRKKYKIGAIAIRSDGVLVSSYNSVTPHPNRMAHAEYKVCQKSDVGTIIYVCRINAKNEYCLAKPCRNCINKMRSIGVKRCYYTINNSEYGVINFI